jgi:hypothetical protein
MKKPFTIAFMAIILLTSCAKSYIQVFDTSTTNTKLSDNYYIFENDTVKVTYSFWASHGIMSFSIFNKLNKPIYIDWKNSSYIANDLKFNYWIDETKTNMAGYYGSYYYDGPVIQPGFAVSEGVQIGTSSAIKPERLTFIPPKSYSTRSQFYLFPAVCYKMSRTSIMTTEQRNDNPKKKTILFTEAFDFANSPLRFRNFLALAFAENAQEFKFIDNEFYLTSVKEMDIRHFRGKYLGLDDTGKEKYEKPFKKKTSFYIQL